MLYDALCYLLSETEEARVRRENLRRVFGGRSTASEGSGTARRTFSGRVKRLGPLGGKSPAPPPRSSPTRPRERSSSMRSSAARPRCTSARSSREPFRSSASPSSDMLERIGQHAPCELPWGARGSNGRRSQRPSSRVSPPFSANRRSSAAVGEPPIYLHRYCDGRM